MTTRSNPTPLDLEARERLRDQQQAEARLLAVVLAAHRALSAERQKASAAIAKAEQAVAMRRETLDAAVVELIDASGVTKAAVLLDRTENELARLRRACQRARNTGSESKVREPGVPA